MVLHKPQLNITIRQGEHYIVVKTYDTGKQKAKGFGRADKWENWGNAYAYYINLVDNYYLNKYREMSKRYVKDINVNAILPIPPEN